MNPYQVHADSVKAVQDWIDLSDEGCPLVNWRNKDRRVIPGTALRKLDINPGGYRYDADLVFSALVTDFLVGEETVEDLKLTMPNTELGYLGSEYRIDSVKIRAGGKQFFCECVARTQAS